MAEHLARIIGTEEDRVNCPFYWKIGACRHGDQCSRSHYKPTASQSIILRHMYQNPPVALAIAEGQNVSDELGDQAQDHFEQFYEEVFEELSNYGWIDEMVICDNIGDHMIGNVYVKYAKEESAALALTKLAGRFYAGRMIQSEYSPVTDFREARCRQFVDGQCTRGGYCNFMHMKHVPRSLKRKLFRRMEHNFPQFRPSRSRSKSRGRSRRTASNGRGEGQGSSSYRSSGRDHHHRNASRNNEHYRDNTNSAAASRGGGGRHNRDDRDYSRGRSGSREEGFARIRQTSQERREMVAKWNADKEAAAAAEANP